jgi:hypothetical protein
MLILLQKTELFGCSDIETLDEDKHNDHKWNRDGKPADSCHSKTSSTEACSNLYNGVLAYVNPDV